MKEAAHEGRISSCQSPRYAGDKAGGGGASCECNRASNKRLSDRRPICPSCQQAGNTAQQLEKQARATGPTRFAKVRATPTIVGLLLVGRRRQIVRTIPAPGLAFCGAKGPTSYSEARSPNRWSVAH